jgi:hypothetical protein
MRGAASHRRGTAETALAERPLKLARVNADWREQGAAFLCVARAGRNAFLDCAFFFVDLLGVGLKDCFRRQAETRAEIVESLEDLEELEWTDCSETLARQIVWGGYHYARRNGFRPPREFHQVRKFLTRLEEAEIPWEWFGRDGEPLIIGDYDDLMRRSGGKLRLDGDEFHYIVGSDDPSPWLELEEDPWNQLFEDESEGIPEGMERVYFIEGTLFSEGIGFEGLVTGLASWRDLDLGELDREEQYATFQWTRPYPRGHWNPLSLLPGAGQVLGHIAVEEDTLIVSVGTKGWMLAAMERLGGIFEAGLTRGPLKIVDPLEELEEEGPARLATSL